MDSRSGPELPHKVHGFRETVKRQRANERAARALSRSTAHRSSLRHLLAIAIVFVAACGPDPHSVEGALATASAAVAARDHEALFQALDERARFSLGSIYFARKAAAAEIRASYPAEVQPGALRELGDAMQADSEVALFRLRCADDCLDTLAATLGAPRSVQVNGRISTVATVRGTETQLYRADDGRYGLVWDSAALVRERTRAAAELDLIKKNGAQYREQRALSEGTR
jgi:hypothetical protein